MIPRAADAPRAARGSKGRPRTALAAASRRGQSFSLGGLVSHGVKSTVPIAGS